MYAQMGLQITSLTERVITHITAIKPIPTMYADMGLLSTLITEEFITHITTI
jgi:hypothetical protein